MNELEKILKIIPESRLAESWIIAMDEVGRGSFFGPVSVGGVIFKGSELFQKPGESWRHRVRDSKKIKPSLRNELAEHIKRSFDFHVSHVSVGFIEKYNINRAIQYGVYRVACYLMAGLKKKCYTNVAQLILLDGNYRFQYPQLRMENSLPQIHSIIKGDEKIFHISCASIIAKVERDLIIQKSSKRFPDYHLDKNAGYGTLQHREAISKKGITAFHRKGFVKKIATM